MSSQIITTLYNSPRSAHGDWQVRREGGGGGERKLVLSNGANQEKKSLQAVNIFYLFLQSSSRQ